MTRPDLLMLQAPVLRRYPARLSVTSFTCFFGIIQFLVIAAFIETDPARWQMHSGGEIFTVLYAGIVASGIAFSVQIWCIDRGGPVFVAVYQPIQTILVAIMAALILGESFYTGAIIGAILIIVGLYLVLWGKSEERRLISETKAASASLPAAQASIISSVEDHGDEEAARLESKSAAADLTQPLLHQQKHSTSSATPETRYS
eukprot:TRINITY_DN5502_c1_g1_i2.p1 TRINITY_DN5502_c1_g1~~TRINITY_DN5502_c1_g1_i2.p1  ORF type:complete len:203 (+),score=27.75 TRINITY_DN5502_c1_g1_i2:192-800(+)